jgi:hypothetical protein
MFVVAALAAGSRPVAAQDLEQHVALNIQTLELSVTEWQERLAVPASDDAEARAAALAAIDKKYKAERDRLYDSYGTTSKAHLAFFGAHAAEVAAYLEDNPEIKTRIDSLSQTVRSLVEQAEARPGGAPGVPQ